MRNILAEYGKSVNICIAFDLKVLAHRAERILGGIAYEKSKGKSGRKKGRSREDSETE